MPLTAITRAVSPSMNNCQLAFVERQPIDIAKAIAQHDQYEACLASLGIAVVSLPAVPDQPDAVFVEDPAIVLDEVAIMTRMGAESRRGESASLPRRAATSSSRKEIFVVRTLTSSSYRPERALSSLEAMPLTPSRELTYLDPTYRGSIRHLAAPQTLPVFSSHLQEGPRHYGGGYSSAAVSSARSSASSRA